MTRYHGSLPGATHCLLLCVLVLTLGGGAVGAASGGPKPWGVGPVPKWVEELALEGKGSSRSVESGEGMKTLLMDQQIRVREGRVERYTRRAKHILTTSGVQNESELKVSFDPTFERLTLHYIRLIRDGRSIDALVPLEVKVIQQETGLDEQIYDETLSAIVFLRDVRAGDVIDFAYSIDGENPVLSGHFTARLHLASRYRIVRLRQRLLWDSGRPLFLKAHGTDLKPETLVSAAGTFYTWERRDVPPVVIEDDTPVWHETLPWVQASDFGTWNDVARWASGLFATVDASPPGLAALAARWKSEIPDPDARALAAIRFVQDDVRYLGMEIGPNTHRPHPPEQVLAQRFGDCKDKALLLTSLLRLVGAEADPALVNTRVRQTLDQWQPSPFAFDHVIVRIRSGGRTAWVDATHAQQGGGLFEIEVPRFRRALLISPDTRELTTIEIAPLAEASRVVEETYTVKADSTGLTVRTTYSGDEANRMRSELAHTPASDLEKRYLNFYAHDDPGLKSASPLSVKDDRLKNSIRVEETYLLGEFWKPKGRRFLASTVDSMLDLPDTRLRSAPLRIPHPVSVRQTIVVHLPDQIHVKPEREHRRSKGFDYESKIDSDGKTLTLDYRYRSLQEAVAVADVEEHVKATKEARDDLSYRIDEPSRAFSAAAPVNDRALQFLGCALGLAGVAYAVRAGRRAVRRRRFNAEGGFRPGEAPATAIPVRTGSELAGKIAATHCRCGARIGNANSQREAIVFNERPMTVVSRTCQWCHAEQTLYFDVGDQIA